MKREPTPEMFLRDVADHKMSVRLSQGVYRHLRFQKSEGHTWNMWFELITWPGFLTIAGDMGTWTFARVEDMFTFFRHGKSGGELKINPSYWAEKLQHGNHGGRDGAKVWDEDLFRTQLKEQLSGYYGLEREELETVTEALEEEVLSQDCKYDLLIAARDFKCRLPNRESDRHGYFQFDSCELPSGKDYSYHFIWCLYAIVWGIQQWDASVVMEVGA